MSGATKKPSFARVIARSVFLVYVGMLNTNYPQCGDCTFSTSLVRECTDVSYVAREGVELAIHNESVVVKEIKEVELRSRRTQFICDRNYNRIGLKPRGHVPSRLLVKTSVTQKEKRKGICIEGYPEKYHFLLFLRIQN